MHKAHGGFSLLELIVAISILAIIMGLVVPNIFRLAAKGKQKATRVAISNVIGAIKEFREDTGSFPSALPDLKVKPSEERLARHWEGPYIEKEPNDAWNHPLVYVLNPKGTQPPFDLYSWGANGEGSPEDEWIREEIS
jgi:general secretion pathway protein G